MSESTEGAEDSGGRRGRHVPWNLNFFRRLLNAIPLVAERHPVLVQNMSDGSVYQIRGIKYVPVKLGVDGRKLPGTGATWISVVDSRRG